MRVRSYLIGLTLGLAAVVLSACRVVVETNVNPDGSGELRTAVVYSAEEKANFAQTPGNSSKSICDSLGEGGPAEATVSEEEHAEETYCVSTQAFADVRELRRLYAGMTNVTVNGLQLDLGRFRFDIDVDLAGADAGQGQPVANEWRLTLPGQLGAHNAERIEGQTLVWDILPGETAHLRAESVVGLSLRSLGPTGLGLLLAGLAVVIAFVAGVVLLGRRRQGRIGRR